MNAETLQSDSMPTYWLTYSPAITDFFPFSSLENLTRNNERKTMTIALLLAFLFAGFTVVSYATFLANGPGSPMDNALYNFGSFIDSLWFPPESSHD